MGFSWVLSGAVEVATTQLDAYRKASVDPSRFTDWPDGWRLPGKKRRPMAVEAVMRAYEAAYAHEIRWTSKGVRLRALISNDDSLWVSLRFYLATAVRMAADVRAEGHVDITGFIDGGPDDVFRIVARRDGTSEVEVLTARAAKLVAKRLHTEAEQLLDATEGRLAAKEKAPPKSSAVVRSTYGPKEAAAALTAMRRALPTSPNVSFHQTMAMLPAVRTLRESRSADLYDAARAALIALTGALRASPLESLTDSDAIHAYALTLVLEPMAKGDDLAMLFRLWTDSTVRVLLDHHRILRHRSEGASYLAHLLGRKTASPLAAREQYLAAQALLETDEKGALAAARALVAEETLSEPHELALRSLLEHLANRPPSKPWMSVVLDASRRRLPSMIAREALDVLVAWKHPKAAERVSEHFDTIGLDRACALLELARDASAVPALESRLAALGPHEARGRARLKECIRLLGTRRR